MGVSQARECVQQTGQVGGRGDVVCVEVYAVVEGGQRCLHNAQHDVGRNPAALGQGGTHAQAQALVQHCSKVQQVALGLHTRQPFRETRAALPVPCSSGGGGVVGGRWLRIALRLFDMPSSSLV